MVSRVLKGQTGIMGLLLLLCSHRLALGSAEEFTFYELQVRVLDTRGRPVEGASVKTYSTEWFLAYPENGFARTTSDGRCTFSIPRGEWTVVAGGGAPYNTGGSGGGLFLVGHTSVDRDKTLRLQPRRAILLTFLDRAGAAAELDSVFAAPSVLVPNCLMPAVGMTRGGRCAIETNVQEKLSLFLVLRPKAGREGYFVFLDELSPKSHLLVRARQVKLHHIRFDGRAPDDSPGPVEWTLCFPYQDLERHFGHTSFGLEGQGDAYCSPDYLRYYARIKLFDSSRSDFIYYCWHYQGVDLTAKPSITLCVGGPLTRQFRFCEIPFSKNRSQFLLGPVLDAHGNELRCYYPEKKDTTAFRNPITIRERKNSPHGLSSTFDVHGGKDNLGFQIDQSFSPSSFFRLEWDLGPYDGVRIMEGSLGDPRYLYDLDITRTDHFDIHTPKWHHEKAKLVVKRWEEAYAVMTEMLGTEPPVTSERAFYVHPQGTWASSRGQELFYHGFLWWHPRDPVIWEDVCFHEIGHRMESELFRSGPKPFPLTNEHHENEAVAEMISHYTIGRLHGEKCARFHWAAKAHLFFSWMKDPANATHQQKNNILFVVEVYLPRRCGWDINKRFIRTWIDACVVLSPLGYRQEEIFAALYSVLANDNLAWAFNLCEFKVSQSRIANAMKNIAHLADFSNSRSAVIRR